MVLISPVDLVVDSMLKSSKALLAPYQNTFMLIDVVATAVYVYF